MDTFNKLSTATKVVLGATVALLIVSFFDWFSVDDLGGVSMWEGIGTLAALLAIALLVWEALRVANVEVPLPISHSMASVLLAILVLLFVFIRFIDKPGGDLVSDAFDRTFWAWLGLLFAIVIVVGAVMRMQAGGESFTDVRRKFSDATSSARARMDRDDTSETAPPPSASTTEPPSETSPDDGPKTA